MKTLTLTPEQKIELDEKGEAFVRLTSRTHVIVDSAGFIVGNWASQEYELGEQVKIEVKNDGTKHDED